MAVPEAAWTQPAEVDWKEWILSNSELKSTTRRNNSEIDPRAAEQRNHDIRTMANRVCSVLSPFLEEGFHTHGFQASLASKHTFVCGPEEFSRAGITPQQRADFQTCLSTQIYAYFEKNRSGSLSFQAEYFPQGTLLEVLSNSGIQFDSSMCVFPRGTNIQITSNKYPEMCANDLVVSVDLTAPPPLRSGELEQLIFHPSERLECARTRFFRNSKEQEEALEEVCEEVAGFLAAFLSDKAHTPETRTLLASKATAIGLPEHFLDYSITLGKINAFKACIRAQIRTGIRESGNILYETYKFNRDEDSTDTLLLQAMKKADIDYGTPRRIPGSSCKRYSEEYAFPDYSSMSVNLNTRTDALKI